MPTVFLQMYQIVFRSLIPLESVAELFELKVINVFMGYLL